MIQTTTVDSLSHNMEGSIRAPTYHLVQGWQMEIIRLQIGVVEMSVRHNRTSTLSNPYLSHKALLPPLQHRTGRRQVDLR